ncbi:MAG: lysine--tRNA ligase [Galactobacillus timonensis]|nr:lysine--tRNA ligase [Galactobacillus timonensis]MCI6067441.1 lysine--tRNA ligase [Galactobacillus timonensis]MCI6754302.1 lysine--tRNA ligase [Galactobacillus timonensis]MDD7087189.1 lysine--tRNA ligase [Galactobacillus timonensis]MDY5222095.1 lysine--tRNA ligase [Lachnospiraceae bacterium]
MDLSDQEAARRQKMEQLRAQGIDPFGQAYDQTDHAADLRAKYGDDSAEDLVKEDVHVSIAGRIMTKRRMGKLGFVTLLDRSGRIQVVINQRIVGDAVYELFKSADLGDIIGVKGVVIKTQTGELSVEAHDYTHLCKALRPLPEKFHGLQDKEERYRRRYLDLIMNDRSREIAMLRPRIIRAIQHYMDSQGYIEVETPVLQPILGGANARPFVTHHNALDKDFYLRIATELPLKRLVVGDLERVYEIGRVFRNEGMDLKHNPEFTTMEAYCAYSDLEGMMKLNEGLFESVANEVFHRTTFEFMGKTVNLAGPYKRWNMVDAVKEVTGVDFWQPMSVEDALKLAKEHNVEVAPHQHTVGNIISLFFDQFCEDKIEQPTFVWGHPIEISPLAKKNPKDPRFTQRFELEIMGVEFDNAFSELNDPIDQRKRFEDQLKAKAMGDEEAAEMDEDYVEALEYGLAPTGGIGFGIDRLVMLLCGCDSIRDVLLFPTMKPREGDKKAASAEPAESNVAAETESAEEKTQENCFFTPNEKIDFSGVTIEPLFADQVDFDTFSRSDFRAVKVKECTAVPKSKKLLKFVLDDGTGTDRVILSGIHAYYEPEELVGKTLIAIVNLPARSMMGIDSCGMLLSAVNEKNGEEELHLLMVDNHIPAGAKLY